MQDADTSEYASEFALDVLDELCVTLLECQLALLAVRDEVDLKFDELNEQLATLQVTAQAAFGAASLLHHRVDLDEPWGSQHSTPRAIYARHRAAVRQGAKSFWPTPTSVDEFNMHIFQEPSTDWMADTASRPRCQQRSQREARQCEHLALRIGNSEFAAHCYGHASPIQLDQFKQFRDQTADRDLASQPEIVARLLAAGREVIGDWLHRRHQGRDWLNR